MGMYFKVAPGVRVRVTKRGVRTSIGPRAARVHVGGGYGAGISTGAGPLTLYHSVGGTRRRRARSTGGSHGRPAGPATVGSYHRQAAAASRSAQAQALAVALQDLQDLHRHPVEPVTAPVAPEGPAVDEDAIRRRHREAARAGLRFWQRAERRSAAERADRDADAEVAAARAEQTAQRRKTQDEMDRRWQELLANDPDVVLATLAEAFEDNEAHAAAVSVDGAEVSLAVFVPGPEIIPDHKPSTTPAGNVTVHKTTRTEQADLYLLAVCGHVLATVREAFAVAPGLASARVAALRTSASDVYGRTRPECLLAATFTRAALEGVDWARASSPAIVEQAGTHLSANLTGRVKHLEPLDLSAEPDLANLLAAVDVDHTDEEDA